MKLSDTTDPKLPDLRLRVMFTGHTVGVGATVPVKIFSFKKRPHDHSSISRYRKLHFPLANASKSASNDGVRTTINIDDDLLSAAAEFTGIDEKSRLVNAVFEKFVAWESAKRIKKLAGSAPDLDLPARSERLSPPAQFLNEPETPYNR